MQTSRFQFTRPALRRTSSTSTSTSSCSGTSSPVHTINAVLFHQPCILDMEAEKQRSGAELSVLEPRPIVYWGGLEERMNAFSGGIIP